MFSTERMKKIELLVLKRDVDDALRYLGFAGCVQLITDGREQRELTPEEREIADLKGKLDSLARFLGIGAGPRDAAEAPSPPAPAQPQPRPLPARPPRPRARSCAIGPTACSTS